jgi:thiamine biosynthesis lipoprotein
MKRRSFMQLGLGCAVAVGPGVLLANAAATDARAGAAAHPAATVPAAAGSLQWRSRTLNAMGTSMTLQLAHADGAQAGRALDAAVAEIRHIEDQMSLFRPDSAICELNRTGRLDHAHPDLLEILHIAQQVARSSQGAFDVTVQPLWLAFESARQQGRLPSAAEVQAARRRVGWQGLQLTESSVRLARPGMGITLNGIAQGYAADKVKARLQSMGIAHALVDAGEWASLGQTAHGGDWTLGVANPRDAHALLAGVALQGRSLATSADDQSSFSPDFANHHIFDPRTGYSPAALSSVTVAAPRCVMADALTKVIFQAGLESALPLARAWQVEVLVVDKQGSWRASPGLALRRV